MVGFVRQRPFVLACCTITHPHVVLSHIHGQRQLPAYYFFSRTLKHQKHCIALSQSKAHLSLHKLPLLHGQPLAPLAESVSSENRIDYNSS